MRISDWSSDVCPAAFVHGPRLRPDAWQAQAKGGLISPERMVRRIGTRRHLIEVAQQIGRVFIDAQCPASLEFLAAEAPREQPHPERTAPRRRQHIPYAVADDDRMLDRQASKRD